MIIGGDRNRPQQSNETRSMTVDSEQETPQEGQLARASEILPGLIHLLPVTTRPFFPGQAVPLLMDAKHWTPTFKAVDKIERIFQCL